MQLRIKKALLELINSEDPRRLSELKKGQIDDEWGYRINDSCRLLFVPRIEKVDEDTKRVLWLDRVCDHNLSYVKRH